MLHVGEGVLDAVPDPAAFGAVRGVHVWEGDLARLSGWCDRLAGMVASEVETSVVQEPAYRCGGAWDGGAVDTEQRGEGLVRGVVPRVDQRDDQSAEEHQLMPGACLCLTFSGPATCFVTALLGHGPPRGGRLLDQKPSC
ncbi:hypothetical protein ADL06_13605 [Streptomyces sp. NRRL F-6491]|nr:hypothetical protein ADL06_13605 [Streptomyces sp. NRRL F-6491]KOX41907.1 hypothetical protein ADL08_17675 [Streptomyces sp. NRRL F-6492]